MKLIETRVLIQDEMREKLSVLFARTLSDKGIPLNEFRVMLAVLSTINKCAIESEKNEVLP